MTYGVILGQTPKSENIVLTNNQLQTLSGESVNNQINLSVINQLPSNQVVRNIYAGVSDLEAGTSSLETGLSYLVYE